MDTLAHKSAIAFLERHEGLVWKIARSFTRTDADCDDLAQEIHVSLWIAFGKVPKDAKESTFVYRVAFNRAVSWHRKKSTYLRHLDKFLAMTNGSRGVYREARPEPDVESLYRAIRDLPEAERSLVLLYLDRRSYSEMSEIVGISEAAVGKRLSRARQRLAMAIQRLEKDDEP